MSEVDLSRALARLFDAARAQGLPPPPPELAAALSAIGLASDFALETLIRWPEALSDWDAWISAGADPEARFPAAWPAPDDAAAKRALRRFRRLECVRLVARDVLGIERVAASIALASRIAEVTISRALIQAEADLAPRFGRARAHDGAPLSLVVIAMGKLGGGELNFSSDIDLVLAFAENGETDGPRRLDHEDYFARVAQRFTALLSEVTVDGLCWRTDFRLRPYGSVGRMVPSFAAMEQYYQREGRDWERYAWIKARAIAGDLGGGHALIAALKPFVYRRYLDWTAIDGLRAMKALIDADHAADNRIDDLKLGRGGIREIEFMVQLIQLTRGGRERRLATPSFYAALDAATALGHLEADAARALRADYDLLRHVENRVQMLGDAQVHRLPADPATRTRLGRALGFEDYAALAATLDRARARVAARFSETLAASATRAPDAAAADAIDDAHVGRAYAGTAPLPVPFDGASATALETLRQSYAARRVDAAIEARLIRLIATAARLAARAPGAADATLARVLTLLAAVAGRTTYLALLEEAPRALERVVEVVARSAWIAERVARHPLLLDDLLDARIGATAAAPAALSRDALAVVAEIDDVEDALIALNEWKLGAQLRVALAWQRRALPPIVAATALATIAERVLDAALALAARDLVRAHGALAIDADGAAARGFAVLAYGSLGGAELGFGSDLDLVFVYDAALATRTSDGARPLDGARWFARLAQRLIHWLDSDTRAGKLYPVDTRLRPDGGKGRLVASVDAFADYQRTRAWTYEHQALVRMRGVAGDRTVIATAAAVRSAELSRPRPDPTADIAAMRARWRAEKDRSTAATLDLKQGAGGLVDIECLTQALLLTAPAPAPGDWPTATPALIAALVATGRLDRARGEMLLAAHSGLLARALDATLDASPRIVAREPEIDALTSPVRTAMAELGLG